MFMIGLFTGTAAGVAIGIILAPTKPDQSDVQMATEQYRDAAVRYCEAKLENFAEVTTWNKWLKARDRFLAEIQEN